MPVLWREERSARWALVSVKFGADNGAKKYMNRLADYLYVLARYTERTGGGQSSETGSGSRSRRKRSGNNGRN